MILLSSEHLVQIVKTHQGIHLEVIKVVITHNLLQFKSCTQPNKNYKAPTKHCLKILQTTKFKLTQPKGGQELNIGDNQIQFKVEDHWLQHYL